MERNKVDNKLDKALCAVADLFLEHYNPCGMGKDGCMRSGNQVKYPCCDGSPIHDGKDCPHKDSKGCTNPNIRCKVSFCWMAVEKMNSECRETFECLETVAKIHGFKQEPPWIGDIEKNIIN